MKQFSIIASLLFLLTETFLIYRCNINYYKEYNIVKGELSKINNIEVVSMGGNPDVTLEDIGATIKMKNGNLISFYGLTQEDFHHSKGITVMHINNWSFYLTGCVRDGAWSGSGITIGEKSEYQEIRSLQIKNVKELIDKFDDLYSVIRKVAERPAFDTLVRNVETVYIQKYDNRTITDSNFRKSAYCK